MDDPIRPIKGYPGYRVSGEGEVQSCWSRRGRRDRMTGTWLPLEPIRRPYGYLSVNLHRGGTKTARYIHHLVLEAFVGPRPPGLICCHWDGDPTNNRVENLRVRHVTERSIPKLLGRSLGYRDLGQPSYRIPKG